MGVLAMFAIISGYLLGRLAEHRIHLANYNAMLVGGAEELIPRQMQLYYRLGILVIPFALLENLLEGNGSAPIWQTIGISFIMLGFCLRLWSIHTLGPQWSMRCLCNYGFPIVRTGPYRYLPHPEYLSRVLDGLGLCLCLMAPLVGFVYVLISTTLLAKIIRTESRQLAEMTAVEYRYTKHISPS